MNETLPLPSFGFGIFFFVIQIAILLAWLILSIFAIRKATRCTSGAATPLWILIVLLVPFIGAIITLACVKPEGESPGT